MNQICENCGMKENAHPNWLLGEGYRCKKFKPKALKEGIPQYTQNPKNQWCRKRFCATFGDGAYYPYACGDIRERTGEIVLCPMCEKNYSPSLKDRNTEPEENSVTNVVKLQSSGSPEFNSKVDPKAFDPIEYPKNQGCVHGNINCDWCNRKQMEKPENQGCGGFYKLVNMVYYENDIKEFILCREGSLCPVCEKNHSSLNGTAVNPTRSLEDTEPESIKDRVDSLSDNDSVTSSGSPNHSSRRAVGKSSQTNTPKEWGKDLGVKNPETSEDCESEKNNSEKAYFCHNSGSPDTLSDKILELRRYLANGHRSMEYWQGDTPNNRGIYVDLGAVMGNIKEFIKGFEEYMNKKFLDEKSTHKNHRVQALLLDLRAELAERAGKKLT